MLTGTGIMKNLGMQLMNNVQKDKVIATQQAMPRSANAGTIITFIYMQ